jgi:hypothetical protein
MSFSLDGKTVGVVQVGIPVPTRPGGKASPERSALEDMEVGESRVFTGYKSRMLVSTCASIRKKFPERRYTVRSMGGGSPVIRVWRME